MTPHEFPKLPDGYRWVVHYDDRYSFPVVVVQIKGRVRVHASAKSFPDVQGSVWSSAQKAAKEAHRLFQITNPEGPSPWDEAREFERRLNLERVTR